MNLLSLLLNIKDHFKCDPISLVYECYGIRICQGVFCKVGLALTLKVFFPAMGKTDSGSPLECSCLLIDYLSSLGALQLSLEKANNMKPLPLFFLKVVRTGFFLPWLIVSKVISYHSYF